MNLNKYVGLYNPHPNQGRVFPSPPKFLLPFAINPHTQKQPHAKFHLLSVIIVLPVLELHIWN